jgi:hypothetical protein
MLNGKCKILLEGIPESIYRLHKSMLNIIGTDEVPESRTGERSRTIKASEVELEVLPTDNTFAFYSECCGLMHKSFAETRLGY